MIRLLFEYIDYLKRAFRLYDNIIKVNFKSLKRSLYSVTVLI